MVNFKMNTPEGQEQIDKIGGKANEKTTVHCKESVGTKIALFQKVSSTYLNIYINIRINFFLV
jgi:hypothetical protein